MTRKKTVTDQHGRHNWWRRHYILTGLLIFIIAVLIVVRIYANTWVLNYVNRSLNNLKGYQGSVKSIDIALYRGAYKIHDLKILKKSAGIPVPFVSIDQADIAVQWSALFHGRIVSNIDLEKPVINFAVSKGDKQTGAGVDWTQPIKKLAPIDINRVTFKNGSLTYQDFGANPKVNVYIHQMQGEVTNLRNVVDKSKPLPSNLVINGDSIGGGRLSINGKMNILKDIPDMDLNTKLENVDLTALNDYSNAYAAVDIKKGNLSVYSEFIVKDKQVSGYIKPLATNLSLIDLKKDSNPIKVAWESVVSAVVTVFTNQSKDQFATKVQLSGNLKNIDTNIWATIGGIIRNAFVHAFDKGLDRAPKDAEGKGDGAKADSRKSN